MAVPAFHTVANALTGEGHRFKVITPGRAVRMSPERTSEDFIEVALDTDRDPPGVVMTSSRGRGRRMVTTERVLGLSPRIPEVTEEDVVSALLEDLLPFIER